MKKNTYYWWCVSCGREMESYKHWCPKCGSLKIGRLEDEECVMKKKKINGARCGSGKTEAKIYEKYFAKKSKIGRK